MVFLNGAIEEIKQPVHGLGLMTVQELQKLWALRGLINSSHYSRWSIYLSKEQGHPKIFETIRHKYVVYEWPDEVTPLPAEEGTWIIKGNIIYKDSNKYTKFFRVKTTQEVLPDNKTSRFSSWGYRIEKDPDTLTCIVPKNQLLKFADPQKLFNVTSISVDPDRTVIRVVSGDTELVLDQRGFGEYGITGDSITFPFSDGLYRTSIEEFCKRQHFDKPPRNAEKIVDWPEVQKGRITYNVLGSFRYVSIETEEITIDIDPEKKTAFIPGFDEENSLEDIKGLGYEDIKNLIDL